MVVFICIRQLLFLLLTSKTLMFFLSIVIPVLNSLEYLCLQDEDLSNQVPHFLILFPDFCLFSILSLILVSPPPKFYRILKLIFFSWYTGQAVKETKHVTA